MIRDISLCIVERITFIFNRGFQESNGRYEKEGQD